MNVTLVERSIKPERVDEFRGVAPSSGALRGARQPALDVLRDPEVKPAYLRSLLDDGRVLAHKKTPLFSLRKAGDDVAAAKK